MSRVANNPVKVPSGVEVTLDGRLLKVKGSKGELKLEVHEWVEVSQDDDVLRCRANRDRQDAVALAGTMRSLINNMVTGVSEGFERKLQLVGVG